MLGRRPRPPAHAVARLERHERVLAWAESAGDTLLATPAGLWLSDEERLGWHLIDRVTWRDGVLTVVDAEPREAPELGAAVLEERPPRSFRLTEPGKLPQVVRERVEGSIAYSARHALTGGGVRVVGRRVSGMDGLRWYVLLDGDAAPDDPQVREVTRFLLTEARTATGPDLD